MKLIISLLISFYLTEPAHAAEWTRPTPAFDSLMDELDLSNSAGLGNFRSRLIHILHTEEISASQLCMLLEVLKEINALQPSVYFDMITNELRRLQSELQSESRRHNGDFIYIFKQRYPIAKSERLRTTILKIPLHIFYFSARPQKSNTRDFKVRKENPQIQKSIAGVVSESKPVSHVHREFL